MALILQIVGAFLLIVGFWAFLGAFERTGEERTRRIRISVGSMIAGLGNILYFVINEFALLLIIAGAVIAFTAKRVA